MTGFPLNPVIEERRMIEPVRRSTISGATICVSQLFAIMLLWKIRLKWSSLIELNEP